MIRIRSHENSAGPDESRLLEIMRETALPGLVSYHYERPRGYAAFAKNQGRSFRVLDASTDDQVRGFTQITWDDVLWEGAPARVAYSGDTRISPSARGMRLSDPLLASACSIPEPVFGAVMESNRAVLDKKLAHWRMKGVNFRSLTSLDALFYRSLRQNQDAPSGIEIRTAEEGDRDALYGLWSCYARSRNLSRHYPDAAAFSGDYPEGSSLGNTLVAWTKGKPVAMLSLWNQDTSRIIRIDSRSVLFSFIPKSMIDLPGVGEELRILYSYRHAVDPGEPEAVAGFRSLITEARARTAGLGRHFFCLGLDVADPLHPVAAKGYLFRNRARIICDDRGAGAFEHSTRSLHLEVGMG
jgi:hypothetical protein